MDANFDPFVEEIGYLVAICAKDWPKERVVRGRADVQSLEPAPGRSPEEIVAAAKAGRR